jgi:hypothetical protein
VITKASVGEEPGAGNLHAGILWRGGWVTGRPTLTATFSSCFKDRARRLTKYVILDEKRVYMSHSPDSKAFKPCLRSKTSYL